MTNCVKPKTLNVDNTNHKDYLRVWNAYCKIPAQYSSRMFQIPDKIECIPHSWKDDHIKSLRLKYAFKAIKDMRFFNRSRMSEFGKRIIKDKKVTSILEYVYIPALIRTMKRLDNWDAGGRKSLCKDPCSICASLPDDCPRGCKKPEPPGPGPGSGGFLDKLMAILKQIWEFFKSLFNRVTSV